MYHATTPLNVLSQAGYDIPQPVAAPVDITSDLLSAPYRDISSRVLEQSRTKTPADPERVHHVCNAHDWSLAQMTTAPVGHRIHRRVQLAALMRQAGLVVPGIYGSNYEDTQKYLATSQSE